MAVGHCSVRQWLTDSSSVSSPAQLPAGTISKLERQERMWTLMEAAAYDDRHRPPIAACHRNASAHACACSLEAIASETCKWMQPLSPPPPSAATDASPPAPLLLGVVVVFRVSRHAFQRATESPGDALCRGTCLPRVMFLTLHAVAAIADDGQITRLPCRLSPRLTFSSL
jgi:hypothetical protein